MSATRAALVKLRRKFRSLAICLSGDARGRSSSSWYRASNVMNCSRSGAAQIWVRYLAIGRYSPIGVPWSSLQCEHDPQFSGGLQCKKAQDGIAHLDVLLCATAVKEAVVGKRLKTGSLTDRKTTA